MIRRIYRRVKRSLNVPVARLAMRVCRPDTLQSLFFAKFEYPRIREQYGDLGLSRDYSKDHILGLSKESGSIRGVIVDNVRKTREESRRLLLPGEYNRDKPHYADLLGLDEGCIVTAGIGADMDFEWDFESSPPNIGSFDYIISQAMLEHLIDPFKHVKDLASLLEPGGHLILHTHIPGFHYHRHPVDCMRFFPDWFEELGKRLGLQVLDRYVGELRICYTYQKLA